MTSIFSFFVGIVGVVFVLAFALGWIPLLLFGGVRWQRKKAGGPWITAAGGAWGLLAVAWVILTIVSVSKMSRHFERYAPQEFNPETYTGEVATVELPYTGNGNLYLYPADSVSRHWMIVIQATNRVVIPAGDYERAWLSVGLSLSEEVTLLGSHLSCDFDTPFSVEQDGEFVFSGGFPLVASVEAEKRIGDQISLDFKMVDSAGNAVTVSNQDRKIGFEALTSDGVPFWADDFEWG
jgi:hypothetical protein